MTSPDQPDRTDMPASSTPSERDQVSRGELVALAIQLDALIERTEENGLAMTAYLLRVARRDLGERLGERSTS